MAIKALEKYGFFDIANENSLKLISQMVETYENFEPNTIWETYSPTEPKPSTQKRNKSYVREDFCGWSALGPISLFIENVLGFYEINSLENKIEWYIHQKCKHGIKNLKFGEITADLLYEKNSIKSKTNLPFSLYIRKDESQPPICIKIQAGLQTIDLKTLSI